MSYSKIVLTLVHNFPAEENRLADDECEVLAMQMQREVGAAIFGHLGHEIRTVLVTDDGREVKI